MKILIVEDKEENRKAAMSAIQEEIEFAVTLDEAVSKLERDDYAAVIIDRNFPRTAGQEQEQLGEELEKVVMNYKIPHIILTEYWHHQNLSQVYLNGEQIQFRSGHKEEEKISVQPKSDPQAWIKTWETLKYLAPNMEEIFNARKRYRKYYGKPFFVARDQFSK